MSIFSKLFGFGIKETGAGIKSVLNGIGSLAKDIREALTGEISPQKRAELIQKAQELEAITQQGQMQINLAEAQHKSVFVAGWRPGIGWILAISLGAYYIPQFIVASILWVKTCWEVNQILPYPIKDISGLTQLILGMLGLAGMRTIEKFGDVQSKH